MENARDILIILTYTILILIVATPLSYAAPAPRERGSHAIQYRVFKVAAGELGLSNASITSLSLSTYDGFKWYEGYIWIRPDKYVKAYDPLTNKTLEIPVDDGILEPGQELLLVVPLPPQGARKTTDWGVIHAKTRQHYRISVETYIGGREAVFYVYYDYRDLGVDPLLAPREKYIGFEKEARRLPPLRRITVEHHEGFILDKHLTRIKSYAGPLKDGAAISSIDDGYQIDGGGGGEIYRYTHGVILLENTSLLTGRSFETYIGNYVYSASIYIKARPPSPYSAPVIGVEVKVWNYDKTRLVYSDSYSYEISMDPTIIWVYPQIPYTTSYSCDSRFWLEVYIYSESTDAPIIELASLGVDKSYDYSVYPAPESKEEIIQLSRNYGEDIDGRSSYWYKPEGLPAESVVFTTPLATGIGNYHENPSTGEHYGLTLRVTAEKVSGGPGPGRIPLSLYVDGVELVSLDLVSNDGVHYAAETRIEGIIDYLASSARKGLGSIIIIETPILGDDEWRVRIDNATITLLYMPELWGSGAEYAGSYTVNWHTLGKAVAYGYWYRETRGIASIAVEGTEYSVNNVKNMRIDTIVSMSSDYEGTGYGIEYVVMRAYLDKSSLALEDAVARYKYRGSTGSEEHMGLVKTVYGIISTVVLTLDMLSGPASTVFTVIGASLEVAASEGASSSISETDSYYVVTYEYFSPWCTENWVEARLELDAMILTSNTNMLGRLDVEAFLAVPTQESVTGSYIILRNLPIKAVTGSVSSMPVIEPYGYYGSEGMIHG